MKSGEHALWDATLNQAQLRQLVQTATTSAEALGEMFADLSRRFARAAEAWGRVIGEAFASMERLS